MTRMRIWLGIAAAMVALPAGAAQRSYTEGGGSGGWQVRKNRHGAVVWRGAVRLYLGRSCDAWSPRYGRGRWARANGGWLVVFPHHPFRFPRQDPPIDVPCDIPS